MSARGILLKPALHEATLRGDKTQTRRVIKLQPFCPGGHWQNTTGNIWVYTPRYMNPHDRNHVHRKCPYGVPGDRLYVKEQLAKDQLGMVCYRRGMERVLRPANEAEREAGWAEVTTWWKDCGWTRDWLSPLHMPKWAARLWLEITRVRVERVQDISTDDVKREGLRWPHEELVPEFRKLWNRINAKRGYSWESNPWVWCIDWEVAT